MILPERVRSQWLRLFASRPEVQRAIVFGSRARGDAEPRSDVDLIILAPEATPEQWVDLWYKLKEDSETLLAIDVFRWEEASEELKQRVLADGEVLYERSKDCPKPG